MNVYNNPISRWSSTWCDCGYLWCMGALFYGSSLIGWLVRSSSLTHSYFQSGTPARVLARVTPAAQQVSHNTIPKANIIPIAFLRLHPIRFSTYCRKSSILWVAPRASAIRKGRIKAATTYKLAYAARRLLQFPGANGEIPDCVRAYSYIEYQMWVSEWIETKNTNLGVSVMSCKCVTEACS